jgi:sarcosine oxidase subunit alpha
MSDRLPEREGEWIDRKRPVAFRFEGESFEGFAGDVLSSALWASGVRLLGRSFKYHRPRGIYSLAGHDVNLLVEDGKRTNLRGDFLTIEPGLDVRSVNTRGGVKHDRLRIIDRFGRWMPVGFYYKAFHTPRRLFPFYENQMRKIAGLGKIDPQGTRRQSPKDYAFCDLLVAGAGPAGLSAAIAAAEQGLDVLLVEEQPRVGGSGLFQHARDGSATGDLRALLEKAAGLEKLKIRTGTQVAGCYADHWIALVDDVRLTKLRARSAVFATGCIEQPAVFQNNDLPGVMLGSAAQRLIYLYRVRPCKRAVILAAGSEGYRLALDLADAGVEVAALADLRHAGEPGQLHSLAAAAGIEILRGHGIYEAVVGRNRASVAAAVLCPLDEHGAAESIGRVKLACDGVLMSVGWTPNAGIAYQAGVRFRYDQRVEQLVPDSQPEGTFVAGRAAGIFDFSAQIASGRRAGLAAAAHLGCYTGEIPAAVGPSGPPPSHPYPIIPHAGKKNFVDLDEDLHLIDFQNAHQEGFDSIELIKRYTTVGMGPTQGKLANTNAVRILARLNGATINETGTTVSRPFHHPVSLEKLAGRRFHPLRRTPLHGQHLKLKASMVHAGSWLRPECYQNAGSSREDCIFQEAQNVRHGVGLIDVSTLGKLQISGPDAGRFLDRIYTGKFVDQKVGRLRYAVGCDEMGIIIEDGIVARTGKNNYYVTATSSGAAAFYRDLQRWAMIFEMDVQLVNATGQLGAINLAGPKSREVLARLTDLSLAADDFPYLGVRQGSVAGAEATLMRVGFVGELGYEIHLPAGAACHVWQSLMEAGREFEIEPFGVEAQRLLRLEKGHLIVGQDTDALTNPFEADLGWMIKTEKPFFIGSRSLQILAARPLERRLVGLALPAETTVPLPEECHLIIEDGEIVGRITSVAHRTTLGQPLALAFVRPEMATAGIEVTICVAEGQLLTANVVPLPFYDPENSRQKLAD